MPAPTKSQLEPVVQEMMAAYGLSGESAPKLAGAMAEVVAQGLNMLLCQVKVAPGIPCPPGATAGPGRLF